ncbi:MAG: prolipoprotein diacylglyceryl transferase [Alphaproteobacteria bacterium]|nr:prolipoprotein diacylglyceryl transferase [Alphaproteobacteria bacterium]
MPTTFIPFPNFDQVIIPIYGPLALRWYSLAYMAGIVLGWLYTRHVLKEYPQKKLSLAHLDDVVSYLIMGVVLGGRLGYVFFYKPLYFLDHPLEILKVWEGGMSFHGGLIGSAVAFALYAWRKKIPFFLLSDVASTAAPIGLFFGRIANFINGEIFGRVTDVPWAVLFPLGGYLPRHPSQLYEAFLEGIVLFVVLRVVLARFDVLKHSGFLSGLFVAGYGVARFIVEFFREPDEFIGYLLGCFTWGQVLSLPLVLYGGYLMKRSGFFRCP